MSTSEGGSSVKPFSDWKFYLIAIAIGTVLVPYTYFNYRHTGGMMRYVNLVALPVIALVWLSLYRFFYSNYRSIYRSRAIAPSQPVFAFNYVLQLLLALGFGCAAIGGILYYTGQIPTGLGPGLFFPAAENDPLRTAPY